MPRFILKCAALLCSLMIVIPASAQFGEPSAGQGLEIMVRVRYERGALDHSVQVDLLNQGGMILSRSFTDGTGNCRFQNVSPGGYKLRVSGMNIETVETGEFGVSANESVHFESVDVKRKQGGTDVPSGFISAHDIQAPEKAKKEVEKGLKEATDKKYDQAQLHFEKAVAIYPNFDSAYLFMGNAFLMQTDAKRAEEAYRRGLAVAPENPRLQTALARILVSQKKLDEAEPILVKAVATDPGNEASISLLVKVEIQKNKCADVYQYSKKAHELQGHKDPSVHLFAGACHEAAGENTAAAKEYETLLKEAGKDDPNVAKAQVRLAAVKQVPDKK